MSCSGEADDALIDIDDPPAGNLLRYRAAITTGHLAASSANSTETLFYRNPLRPDRPQNVGVQNAPVCGANFTQQ
jgi:hypothetical protein